LRGLPCERLLQSDFHVVALVHPSFATVAAGANAAAHTEDTFEDIGEGRAEVAPEPGSLALFEGGMTEAVIGGTLGGILENLVGLVDLLEASFAGNVTRITVGMPLQSQLAEGSLQPVVVDGAVYT
jgi:hypothetical protein